MTETAGIAPWRAIGGTVAGASHVRAGAPNQDAIHLPAGGELPLLLAVSDGHGSPKCFRSDRGSRLAVGTAVVVMRELLERASGEAPDRLGELASAWAPGEIARRWREAVELDLALSPVSSAELEALEARDGAKARRLVAENQLLAYGATVLAAAVAERFLAFAQLGDGDILVVSPGGEVARPLAGDERLFAGETTSLASPSAARDFRTKVLELSDPRPALVMLSTDGYANSFRDEAGFLKVGADLVEMIGASGLDAVAREIPVWLDETSRMGSGDDVTLAIACRTDAIRAPDPPAAREPEPPPAPPPGSCAAGEPAPETPDSAAPRQAGDQVADE